MKKKIARLESSIHDHPYLSLLFFYSLSFGLVLFNFWGIYFDDWVLYVATPESIHKTFADAGAPWTAYFQIYTNYLLGPWGGHILVYVYYLLAGYLVHAVLQRASSLSKLESVYLAALFMTVPVNSSRILAINSPYGVCLLCFCLGFYLFEHLLEKNGFLLRIFSLACFAAAMMTAPSFLVFYGTVPLFFLFKCRLAPFEKIAVKTLSYLDYWLLPLLIFFGKPLLFPLSGAYKAGGYNSIQGGMLVSAFGDTLMFLVDFLYQDFSFLIGLFLLVLLVAMFERLRGSHRKIIDFGKAFWALPICGLGLLYLGAFPYVVVGKIPLTTDWNDRYQLLLPFGIALVCYSMIRMLKLAYLKTAIFLLIVSVFSIKNSQQQLAYYKDWIKQDAIMFYFSDHEELQEIKTYEVLQKGTDYNRNQRSLRFYEYTGMVRRVFGVQDILLIEVGTWPRGGQEFMKARGLFSAEYNLADYQVRPVKQILAITEERNISGLSVLGLWLQKLVKPIAYRGRVGELVSFEVQGTD